MWRRKRRRSKKKKQEKKTHTTKQHIPISELKRNYFHIRVQVHFIAGWLDGPDDQPVRHCSERKAYSRDLYLFFRRNYMLCNDDNDIRKMVNTARSLVWGAAVGIGGGGRFGVRFFSSLHSIGLRFRSGSIEMQEAPAFCGWFFVFREKKWVLDGIHDNAPYNYKPMGNIDIDIMFYLDAQAHINMYLYYIYLFYVKTMWTGMLTIAY